MMIDSDYKINVGRVNWLYYDQTLSDDDFYMKNIKGRTHIFCRNQNEADYIKMKFPEWFL